MKQHKIKLLLALAIFPELIIGCSGQQPANNIPVPKENSQNKVITSAEPIQSPVHPQPAQSGLNTVPSQPDNSIIVNPNLNIPVKPSLPPGNIQQGGFVQNPGVVKPVSPVVTKPSVPVAYVPALTALEIKSVKESGVVAANTRFGLKLFSELLKKDMKKNIFISPASISLALLMTYNGADTETKTEMAKTLEVVDLSLEEVNKANSLLIKKLVNPGQDIQLNIANSIWADKNRVTFKPEFLKNNLDFYGAKLSNLNFSDPASPGIINQWVKDSTNNKIDKIIGEIDPSIIFYIINAIYFKADWSVKFDKKDTIDRTFRLLDGEKQHPLMSKFGYFKFFSHAKKSEEKFEAVSLDYGKGERVGMYIFLPDKTSSLEEFYKELAPEKLDKWLNSSFYGDNGYVTMPRFKMEYESQLNDPLKALGMPTAFSDFGADFSKLGQSGMGNIFISEVKHKTFVEVNEEGTEAAAVTVVAGSAASSPPMKSIVVDRPFFFVIRDNETGEIIFMGSIVDPK